MKIQHYLSASILAVAAQAAFGQVINIPQSALLPAGDPGRVPWFANEAGLSGPTTVKLIAEITGTAIANSFVLDVQNNGFPAPPVGGLTDDVVVFGPEAVPGAMATVDIPPGCGLALFHDVYDETGEFLSGPNGILNENPVPGTSDAYLSSNTEHNYTVVGRRQLVKYYLVHPAHTYQFTSQWGTATPLGSGFRAFIFLDDDHSPNYDYDDIIIGVLAPPCVENAGCSDGELCNGEETCVDGVCHAGVTVVCDDGIFCNGVESCLDGTCEGGSPPTCDDGIACTDDSCNANQCVHTPYDAHCPNDGIFCNGTESCDGLFGCVSSGSPCEVGAICDEETDLCRICNNDADCDDSNPCTVGHACVDGACVPGASVDCSSAGNQCAAASCDPSGGVGNCDGLTPVQNGTSCDDGLYCTVIDSCQAGNCGGTARDCSALGDQCYVAVCNEESDTCQTLPLGGETMCDDGDECTVGDACEAGVCHGLLLYGLEQWSALVGCLIGLEGRLSPECACWDMNSDGHVDLRDAAEFQTQSIAP
jgi:hypothetical protein